MTSVTKAGHTHVMHREADMTLKTISGREKMDMTERNHQWT